MILLDSKPSSIVDLTDGDSNIVLQVENKYLYKEFFSTDQFRRDVAGVHLFGLLTGEKTPLLVFQGENFYVSEFIQNSTTCYQKVVSGNVDMTQVSSVIAGFVGKTFRNFKYFDKSKVDLYPYLRWNYRINFILNKFCSNEPELVKSLTKEQYEQILKTVWHVANDKTFNENQTLLHRDIHLDNILVKDEDGYFKFYVIDFEHCMEGPIELEFQNSLLWKDEKSLDVENVVDTLIHVQNVPYSKEKEKILKSVYFADQLNLAIEGGFNDKIALLKKKFYEL